jgi:diguanylate cyclase (GGDEF)-like protein
MQWLWKHGILLVLGGAVVGGVAAAGAGVYRALRAIDVLAEIGAKGAAAQHEIQSSLMDSRRAMWAAFSAPDLGARVSEIVEARSADARIERSSTVLLGLLADPGKEEVRAFLAEWRGYVDAREAAILLVLAGQVQEGQALGARRAAPAHLRSDLALRAIQSRLDRSAAEQQKTVRTVLFQALAEMAILAVATILFVASLMWSYRRQREMAFIRQRNEELALAQQLEEGRSRILEMTGRNEPLPAILQALASLAQRQIPGAAACVVAMPDGHLREVIAPSLPRSLINHIRAHPDQHLAGGVSEEAGHHGLKARWTEEVTSNTGQPMGCLDVYFDHAASLSERQRSLLEGAARLAAVAIQHRQLYEQLAFQAQRDPLTELPNRRVFQDRLEQAILRSHREKQKAAVLLIDLDRFKQVNDLLGHRVGDALLRAVAQRIAACLRKSDTVARIGGDEFTVLLNNVEGVEAAEAGLLRILQALQKPVAVLDHEIAVSASIGMSVYPDHGQDSATLVRNADLAMYHAKGRGKNGWQTYMPELGAVMLRRMSIEKSLESAIENHELEIYYQAQTDFQRRLTGLEALIRWSNPVLGAVPPEIFIPVAEESGLVVPIGAWVMSQACRQAAAWLQAGYAVGRVAVNISARQLAQNDFIEIVRRTLESSGLGAEHLELELTETALMHNIDDCLRRLSALRELGVTVAIDDFGTGYSSLGYLQKLPVNRVKVDQSFVSGITSRSQETLPLIRAIVDLAHGLGLEVIAEGVETESQLEVLRSAGCDAVQGFLLHKPCRAEELTGVLRAAPDLMRLQTALQESATPDAAAPVAGRGESAA